MKKSVFYGIIFLLIMLFTASAYGQSSESPVTSYSISLLPEGDKLSDWAWTIDWEHSTVSGSAHDNAKKNLSVWLAIARNHKDFQEMARHYYTNYSGDELLDQVYGTYKLEQGIDQAEMLTAMLGGKAAEWHLVYKPAYRVSTRSKFN